ncbi:hypothetical protein AZL_012860 [Azospirillum sp. B510]|uniref:PRC-barrel domain-containing protein n=1 Tax=Azospirillum sp. (strain B510) TaxID=137722 RepID=UPI0001C4C1E8|nr:PRC-barrel domain-containing protein [Azospirillum sp. B510]BAI71924.1 hypothetical protein AZL_012860 [Azospirillum sp. B510]
MDHRRLSLRLLFAGLPVLTLGACASSDMGGVPAAEMATEPPLELVGLTVQTPDGRRMLGNVTDLVIGPTNRVEQAVVTVGAPLFPNEHKVAVASDNLRYARDRQAVILTGMSAEEFAALPPVGRSDRMVSFGGGESGGETTLPAGPAPAAGGKGAGRPR